ncbi:MAG TPA: nuclear transport factor 2 family protein [Caulobacteraceae bacterium]|jgi:hypothetical protein
MSDENKALTVRFFEEAFNEGNLGVIDELISPDYRFNGVPSPPANTKAWVQQLRASMPGLHFVIEAILAEDDKVALRWRNNIPAGGGRPAGSIVGTNILSFIGGQALTNDQSGGEASDFKPD